MHIPIWLKVATLAVLLIAVLVFGETFGRSEAASVTAGTSQEIVLEDTLEPTPFPSSTTNSLWIPPVRDPDIPDIEIAARAVFSEVLLGQNHFAGPQHAVLLEHQPDTPFAVASLTKLATALVAMRAIPQDMAISVSKDAVATYGPAGNLAAGEEFLRDDLLAALLIPSSNDAAAAIEEYLGGRSAMVRLFGELSQDLGLLQTSFKNPHGLDEEGHVSSARDIARLLEETIREPVLINILGKKEARIARKDGSYQRTLISTNDLLSQMEGILAGKTGFTDDARGTIVVAFRPTLESNEQRTVVLVVLGAEDRFAEANALIRWIRVAYDW